MMEFTTDRLGTFVATVQPRVERVTLTDQGLLYNAKLNRYISLRFPKKCVDHDTHIEIRVSLHRLRSSNFCKLNISKVLLEQLRLLLKSASCLMLPILHSSQQSALEKQAQISLNGLSVIFINILIKVSFEHFKRNNSIEST